MSKIYITNNNISYETKYSNYKNYENYKNVKLKLLFENYFNFINKCKILKNMIYIYILSTVW